MRGAVMRDVLVRALGAVTHPPRHRAAERVARGGHEYRGPEEIGIELDQPEHRGFGAHRQQRRGHERDHEHRRQAVVRQREPVDQLFCERFHGADGSMRRAAPARGTARRRAV